MFENYKDSLFNDKIILKLQQRFRSYYHEVCTEGVNKVALSSNDDKRLQTLDQIITYPYGTPAKFVNQTYYKNEKAKRLLYTIDQ